MVTVRYDSLGLAPLLQAESEEQVLKISGLAFDRGHMDEQAVTTTATNLNISAEMAKEVLIALRTILQHNGSTSEAAAIEGQFPESCPREMITLIASAVCKWKQSNLLGQRIATSCMPQLADFDWRVDMKAASLTRTSEPTCLLRLSTRRPVENCHGRTHGEVEEVDVELTKQAMDTVLDGLGKIRDQLSNIAK